MEAINELPMSFQQAVDRPSNQLERRSARVLHEEFRRRKRPVQGNLQLGGGILPRVLAVVRPLSVPRDCRSKDVDLGGEEPGTPQRQSALPGRRS